MYSPAINVWDSADEMFESYEGLSQEHINILNKFKIKSIENKFTQLK